MEPELSPVILVKHLEGHNLMNGKLTFTKDQKSFPVYNPATMDIIGEAPESDFETVHQAVEFAYESQKNWRKVDAQKRGYLLLRCVDLLEKHSEELARLMSFETGKAIRTESRVEVSAFINALRFYSGLGLELKGETVPFNPDMLTITIREPVGVVGAIIPWNVPLLLMAFKIGPAIIAGNTVVLKSAEQAPFTVLRAAELINTILPEGVLNVISGDGPNCGAALVTYPKVKKITFTGSVEAGRSVYQLASEKLIPVTLELGGKSAMIVSDDVNIDRAVEGAFASMRFTRQGQSCSAASRIFVHENIFDEFLKRLKQKLNMLKIGDPMDETSDVGSMISSEQYERVQRYIEIGKNSQGGEAHECGVLPNDPNLKKGLFVRPVLFTGLSNQHQLCQEEIFGPVTCLISWRDYDEVIDQANDTNYGLAATIWTNDFHRALDAVHRLEAGFVQINQNIVVQPGLSYGGMKNSGLGKEASTESMLEHFTHKKTIIANLKSIK